MSTTDESLHRIKGLVWRDDTLKRIEFGGALTWGQDDRQFVSMSDGLNRTDPPTKAFHSCVYALRGDPSNPILEELPGYPHMPMRMVESDYASYWGGSCLAVNEKIYQFLMTTNHPYLKPDATFWPGFRAAGAKLIYSPDQGLTWNNQDGSHPVKWDNWDARSKKNMAFFNEEPFGAFSWPTFLQMGRGYEANEDGYVYIYGANGDVEGSANELAMFRVPKDRVLDRQSYEFFSGRLARGEAAWTKDMTQRAVVHTFPKGWVSRSDQDGMIPFGWNISVVYNEVLGVYMMVGQGTGVGADGGWFGKPSYLGFWVAPTPWGPFKQVHEEQAWTPGKDTAARAFVPQIAPKWISPNGKSFWLAWSDYQYKGDAGETANPDAGFLSVAKHIVDDAEFARTLSEWSKTHMAGGCKMQRVDLIVE